MRDAILKEVLEERIRQIEKCRHDGDTDEFDKSNTRNDWICYITGYASRVADKLFINKKDSPDFRTNMKKVAALAIAAIEAHDQGWC